MTENGTYTKQFAQQRWDAATAAAILLVVDLDADDGSNEGLADRRANLEGEFCAAGTADRSVAEDQSGHEPMMNAYARWQARRRNVLQKREAHLREQARLRWRRITIGKADVTKHVAAMFDVLVASLDWGSKFLDAEEIESVLIVAELAGFATPERVPVKLYVDDVERLVTGQSADGRTRMQVAIAEWRRQVSAKARALAGDGEPQAPVSGGIESRR